MNKRVVDFSDLALTKPAATLRKKEVKMSSEPTTAGTAAASEAGGQEVGLDDLGYEVPVTVEDAPVVAGRSEVERLLQVEAKTKNVRGLVAGPMATLKDGVPQHLAWVLTAVAEGRDGSGNVQRDNFVKWNGLARNLFKDAGEDVCLR